MFYEHYENICFTKAEIFIFGKRKTKLLTTTATFQVFVPSSCTDNLIQKIKFRQLSMHVEEMQQPGKHTKYVHLVAVGPQSLGVQM